MVTMINVFLEGVSTALLIGASLLLYFWKRKEKDPGDILIKKIGLCVSLIGLFKLSDIIINIYSLSEISLALNKLISLTGLIILMFSLFKFLEDKK